MRTLAGVEMGLALAGVPHKAGGVAAAMGVLKGGPELAEVRAIRAASRPR